MTSYGVTKEIEYRQVYTSRCVGYVDIMVVKSLYSGAWRLSKAVFSLIKPCAVNVKRYSRRDSFIPIQGLPLPISWTRMAL